VKDLLNVESTQRVDLRDFLYAIDEGQQEAHRELGGNFLIDPDTAQSFRVLSGFGIDCPAATTQVRVTQGRAILGQRDGGVVYSAVISTQGDAVKIVDLTAYAAGTYGIYIRFEYSDGDSAVRTFWDPSGGGSEFSQLTATRRLANWSVRVESASPGAEWFKLGEVDRALLAAPNVGILDQRKFYFEGNVQISWLKGTWTWNGTTTVTATDTSQISNGDWIRLDSDGQWFEVVSFVPNTSALIKNPTGASIPTGATGSSFSPDVHESGWSADGGGVALDRSSDRETYGIADLASFSSAMRQCLEDIKGRGLRKWWDRDIGGMNIGFDADPVEGRLALMHASSYLSGDGAGVLLAGSTNLDLSATDAYLKAVGLRVGTSAVVPVAGNAIFSAGVAVGFAANAPAGNLMVGDSNFTLAGSATIPSIWFDTGDIIRYDRAGDRFQWYFGGVLSGLDTAAAIFKNRFIPRETLATPTSQDELVGRYQNNSVLACGTYAGSVSPISRLGSGYNIPATMIKTPATTGVYTITLPQAINSLDVSVQATINTGSGGNLRHIQAFATSPTDITIFTYDTSGNPANLVSIEVVYIAVFGSPQTPTAAF